MLKAPLFQYLATWQNLFSVIIKFLRIKPQRRRNRFFLTHVNCSLMKTLMSYFLKKLLVFLSEVQIRRYSPVIIGITGNAGKTSTKEMTAALLRYHGSNIRVAAGNLNSELGFALTILGNWDEEYYNKGSSSVLWLKVLWAGFYKLFLPRRCAEIFLLEYGADHPGDIKRLATAFKPHISIITTVGDTPVHVEFFKNADAVAEEKANLVKILKKSDYAILNHDDTRVLEMKLKTGASVMTYGFLENSTIRISDFSYMAIENKPAGVEFKIHKNLEQASVKIIGSVGVSQAYAAAAAAAAGTLFGMTFRNTGSALLKYRGPNGRLKIIPGINNSTIIDDTYNASPASMRLALEALCHLPASRRIAVLGDMLELGEHAIESHRNIGSMTASCADILVCVGPLSKFIAETSKIPKDKIFTFKAANEAKIKIRNLIKYGDAVLVKGSQGMRMEKIVAEIMEQKERKKELLVRQSKNWLSKF